MKRKLSFVASILFLLAPIKALAVQYDGIQNLTTSTRTYTLSNPAQSISIAPGATVIIQDTQFQTSTALQSDVGSGYVSEYVIGSPNATTTVYAQPIQINSSSNSVAGLLVNESSGQQPGLGVTQTNAGDIIDAYQSQQIEFALNNAQLTVNPPAVFNNALTLGAVNSVGGILQFGSSSTARITYATTAGTFPANTFGFTGGGIGTSSNSGYAINATQVLYEDSSYTNLSLNTPQNGVVYLQQNGATWGTLQPSSGLTMSGGSSYGNNAIVAGNLVVGGATAFNALTATNLIAGAVTSPSSTNLAMSPSTGDSITLNNSTGTNIARFNDNQTYSFGNGYVNGTASSFSIPTLTVNTAAFTNGSVLAVGAGTGYKDANSSSFFAFQSAAGVTNVQFNDNGTGQLNPNITYDAAGNIIARSFTTSSGLSGTSMNLTGTLTAGDIYAVRTSNTGALFLGSNGTHGVYYDGTNYNMPAGNLILGGNMTAGTLALTGSLTLPATGSIALGSGLETYTSNLFTFNQPINVTSSNYSTISNLYSTSIVSGSLTNTAALNISTNNVLTLTATQINVSTSGAINVGGSSYGNTVANVTGSVNTPIVNSPELQNIGNGITINANNGNSPVNILSSGINLKNSQAITSGNSSYGVNANVAGNLNVTGTVTGTIMTLNDQNNTSQVNAYHTAAHIVLGAGGTYTFHVSGSRIIGASMVLQDVSASSDIIPCIISNSGNTLVIGAHYAGLPNSQASTAGAGFFVTIDSF